MLYQLSYHSSWCLIKHRLNGVKWENDKLGRMVREIVVAHFKALFQHLFGGSAENHEEIRLG
jgi:hypothetical protein